MEQYRRASSDKTLTVFVSTASPYKFCGPVLTAIRENACRQLDWSCWTSFTRPPACRCPSVWRRCRGKPRRFDKTVEKQAMETAVLDFLK